MSEEDYCTGSSLLTKSKPIQRLGQVWGLFKVFTFIALLVFGACHWKRIRHRYSTCHKVIFGALVLMTGIIASLRFMYDLIILVFILMLMGSGLTFWGLTRFLKYYYPDKHAVISGFRWLGASIYILIACFGLIPYLANIYGDSTVYNCRGSKRYPLVFIVLNAMTAIISALNFIYCCKNKKKPDRDLAEACDPTNVQVERMTQLLHQTVIGDQEREMDHARKNAAMFKLQMKTFTIFATISGLLAGILAIWGVFIKLGLYDLGYECTDKGYFGMVQRCNASLINTWFFNFHVMITVQQVTNCFFVMVKSYKKLDAAEEDLEAIKNNRGMNGLEISNDIRVTTTFSGQLPHHSATGEIDARHSLNDQDDIELEDMQNADGKMTIKVDERTE